MYLHWEESRTFVLCINKVLPCRFSFVFPVSMTNTTSGMVTPVSAMFVDRTIWNTHTEYLHTPVISYTLWPETQIWRMQYLPDSSGGHCKCCGLLLRRERRVQSYQLIPTTTYHNQNSVTQNKLRSTMLTYLFLTVRSNSLFVLRHCFSRNKQEKLWEWSIL